MTKEERNKIKKMILNCRRILENEFDELLRLKGFLPDRIIEIQDDTQHKKLKKAILSQGPEDYHGKRVKYVKNSTFTFLNRLLYLKMAEINNLIDETITTREKYGGRSKRERDIADENPALATSPEKLAHEAIKSAFKEMAAYIKFVFREDHPYGILIPRLPAYRKIRKEFENLPENLWHEFETLGWAYQYYNSEERKEIRKKIKGSPKPDQIPPINQFYTVDWIVKVLVQNTLGRLWIKHRPDSPLRSKLKYLVPYESESPEWINDLKVENIKILDPACGSGHFLLYAFDLLFEMWHEENPDLELWEIPAKILEHNLYGVDIDLRAAQIAAISLYLKARTVFEEYRESSSQQFKPRRLNIVTADIHFHNGKNRLSLLSKIDEPWRDIVNTILDESEIIPEVGSLFRIRQPVEQILKEKPKNTLNSLLPESKPTELYHNYLQKILDKIREFIHSASSANDMGSLIFGMDVEQAVQFIDILVDQYDIILMNPPYGAMTQKCKEYAKKYYPRSYNDYYAAFIEQAINLTKPGGYIGALTGRTFMFLKSFRKLRENVLREEALPEIVLDLGFDVLDEATARYAAFTLKKRWENDGIKWETHPVLFFRLTDWQWDEKRIKFEEALEEL